jgi:hypothetical protein
MAIVGDVVTVSATVRSMGTGPREIPVSLWLNDRVEENRIITLPAGAEETISFTVVKRVGDYSVRIDRQTGLLHVVRTMISTAGNRIDVPSIQQTPLAPTSRPESSSAANAFPVILAVAIAVFALMGGGLAITQRRGVL